MIYIYNIAAFGIQSLILFLDYYVILIIIDLVLELNNRVFHNTPKIEMVVCAVQIVERDFSGILRYLFDNIFIISLY